MKQMTQKELIKLIKEKQNKAEVGYAEAVDNSDYYIRERNKAFVDCYQSILVLLTNLEIVPEEKIEPYKKAIVGENYENCFAPNLKVSDKGCVEEQIVTTIPKDKREELGITQEDLRDMIEKTPIIPYNEPKVEPIRNDRLREFLFGNGAKRIIDAKAVKTISIEESYTGKGYDVYVDTIIMKKNEPYDNCRYVYYDLVEWWKYWKQN